MPSRARANRLGVILVLSVALLGGGTVWGIRKAFHIGEFYTFSWVEEVALRNGDLLRVTRTRTNHSQPWGPPGNGGIQEQTMSFSLDGKFIEWKWDEPWQMASRYMPDILDIVAGEPVIVMPVDRDGPCEKYGYPPEGVVAFRFHVDQWSRIPVSNLPQDLRVNLLTSMHLVQHQHLEQVTMKKKTEDEGRTATIRQGMPLSELIWKYSNEKYACAVLRPTPNQLYDEARDTIEEAERHATLISTDLLESSSVRQKLTGQDFARNVGTHTNGGYVRSTCDGIVEGLEPYYVKRDGDYGGYSIATTGYRIVPKHSTTGLSSVPILGTAVEGSQSVACDTNTIYAIKRPDRQTLVVHRFSNGGALIDAFRIDLTPINRFLLDNQRSTLWNVSPSTDGTLLLTFAVIEPNWFLGERVTIRAVLPAPPQKIRPAPWSNG